MRITSVVGIVVCLFLAGCTGGSGGTTTAVPSEDGVLPRNDIRGTETLYPYRSNSPYNNVLKACAAAKELEDACTLQRLPYIGQSGNEITTADVLDRLLVSHDWMGERFAEVLEEVPNDMLRLFASVTAISIGSTVRPSFYLPITGGISLDPVYLWTTLEEKANVSIADDYRSGYGSELNFWRRQTLRVSGQPPYIGYRLTSYETRNIDELILPLHALLYHELAHAVDFMPLNALQFTDVSMTPVEALESVKVYSASPQLVAVSPLQSDEMYDLGQVQFRGIDVTEQQRRYTPANVGSFMSSDGAMTYYSYSSIYEDFANLFEHSMMKKHLNADFLMAFVTKPQNVDYYSCSDLRVGWGQFNRLSDPYVWTRAKWVVERVYGPSEANTLFFDGLLGQASEMSTALNWCDNRDGIFASGARHLGLDSKRSDRARSFEQLELERLREYHR